MTMLVILVGTGSAYSLCGTRSRGTCAVDPPDMVIAGIASFSLEPKDLLPMLDLPAGDCLLHYIEDTRRALWMPTLSFHKYGVV
jgi:hypothetical protein